MRERQRVYCRCVNETERVCVCVCWGVCECERETDRVGAIVSVRTQVLLHHALNSLPHARSLAPTHTHTHTHTHRRMSYLMLLMLPASDPSLHRSSWVATICLSASNSRVSLSNCSSWRRRAGREGEGGREGKREGRRRGRRGRRWMEGG